MSTAEGGLTWVLPTPDAVARRVADWLTERALAKDGRFVIALSGGSTPKRLYEILAASPLASRFPWSRTELFFGDERFVPADDESSNYRMVDQALLSRVALPRERVHRWPTEGDPQDAVASYGRELRATYGDDTLRPGRPLFDVVLLGLGDNGHTASLFPGTAILEERSAWVGTCVPHDAPHRRLSLTYPAIASSAHVLFLVTGAAKSQALGRVRASDPSQPASRVTTEGELIWVLDEAAARSTDTGSHADG